MAYKRLDFIQSEGSITEIAPMVVEKLNAYEEAEANKIGSVYKNRYYSFISLQTDDGMVQYLVVSDSVKEMVGGDSNYYNVGGSGGSSTIVNGDTTITQEFVENLTEQIFKDDNVNKIVDGVLDSDSFSSKVQSISTELELNDLNYSGHQHNGVIYPSGGGFKNASLMNTTFGKVNWDGLIGTDNEPNWGSMQIGQSIVLDKTKLRKYVDSNLTYTHEVPDNLYIGLEYTIRLVSELIPFYVKYSYYTLKDNTFTLIDQTNLESIGIVNSNFEEVVQKFIDECEYKEFAPCQLDDYYSRIVRGNDVLESTFTCKISPDDKKILLFTNNPTYSTSDENFNVGLNLGYSPLNMNDLTYNKQYFLSIDAGGESGSVNIGGKDGDSVYLFGNVKQIIEKFNAYGKKMCPACELFDNAKGNNAICVVSETFSPKATTNPIVTSNMGYGAVNIKE